MTVANTACPQVGDPNDLVSQDGRGNPVRRIHPSQERSHSPDHWSPPAMSQPGPYDPQQPYQGQQPPYGQQPYPPPGYPPQQPYGQPYPPPRPMVSTTRITGGASHRPPDPPDLHLWRVGDRCGSFTGYSPGRRPPTGRTDQPEQPGHSADRTTDVGASPPPRSSTQASTEGSARTGPVPTRARCSQAGGRRTGGGAGSAGSCSPPTQPRPWQKRRARNSRPRRRARPAETRHIHALKAAPGSPSYVRSSTRGTAGPAPCASPCGGRAAGGCRDGRRLRQKAAPPLDAHLPGRTPDLRSSC